MSIFGTTEATNNLAASESSNGGDGSGQRGFGFAARFFLERSEISDECLAALLFSLLLLALQEMKGMGE